MLFQHFSLAQKNLFILRTLLYGLRCRACFDMPCMAKQAVHRFVVVIVLVLLCHVRALNLNTGKNNNNSLSPYCPTCLSSKVPTCHANLLALDL